MDKEKWDVTPTIPSVIVWWAHLQKPVPIDFIEKCEANRHASKKLVIRRYEK
jgi:hypothetical protein